MSELIRRMVASRKLEQVTPNRDHARSVLAVAERHVHTATLLARTEDQAMAFSAAYDGARKALSAVLSAEGLRARPVGGAHRNTGVAAAEFVKDASLREFEWMRQVRNSTECPHPTRPTATNEDVHEAISAAQAIVEACADQVGAR